jgi:hypothetical protein
MVPVMFSVQHDVIRERRREGQKGDKETRWLTVKNNDGVV